MTHWKAGVAIAAFGVFALVLAPWLDVICVGISGHQRDIDGASLAASGIAFADIKATEDGSVGDLAVMTRWLGSPVGRCGACRVADPATFSAFEGRPAVRVGATSRLNVTQRRPLDVQWRRRPLENLSRRIPVRRKSEPGSRLVSRHKLGDGRNIRKCRPARRRGDGQRSQLAGFDVLDRRQERGEHERNRSANDVSDRGPLAR
jgi:hypothetical protein